MIERRNGEAAIDTDGLSWAAIERRIIEKQRQRIECEREEEADPTIRTRREAAREQQARSEHEAAEERRRRRAEADEEFAEQEEQQEATVRAEAPAPEVDLAVPATTGAIYTSTQIPEMLVPRLILLDRAKNPPREKFVVGSLFAFGKPSVMYGPSGAGKSTFEDWENKAAACMKGCPDIDIEQALKRVHIVHDAMGEARLTEIVQVRTGDGIISNTRRERRETATRRALIGLGKQISPRLILLETVSRLVDDEDNPTLAALLSAAGHIAAETGAAVVLSHHPTKAASKDNDSRAESARGGGALISNSRGAVSLFPADEKVLSCLAGRGFNFASDDVLVLGHEKGTSSVPKQKPITLVRCSTEFGGVFKLPEEVARDPNLAAPHAARAARDARARDANLAALYDKVAELKKCGPVSKNKLRDHGELFGCARNNVDSFVDEALLAAVLKITRTDKAGRVLDMALGERPAIRPDGASQDWATPGDHDGEGAS